MFETENQEKFCVQDDRAAEWCLRKIAEAKAEKEKWKEYYAEQTRKSAAEADGRIAFFEGKLAEYFDSVPHKKTKTQESYALPSGKLVFKRQAPEYQRDETALLPWLRENLVSCVKVMESVDWAQLKGMLVIAPDGETVTDDSGEIIPGLKAIQRPDVFQVQLSKEG